LSIDETKLESHVSFSEASGYHKKPKEVGGSTLPRPILIRRNADGAISDSQEAFSDRIRVFKKNVLPPKKNTPLWRLMWLAYNDKVLLLLTGAAIISLALGLYETFRAERGPSERIPVDWVEGLAICIAILIVVLVGSLNDFQKERAFAKLNNKVSLDSQRNGAKRKMKLID
jgi:Ca2+-transporting ATPase